MTRVVDDIHRHIDHCFDDYLAKLMEFIRIPSISTLPSYTDQIRRGADFVADQLRQAGLENVRVIETSGSPLVSADWLHAPGQPTIIIYGHYDVQPVDPIGDWVTPPFEPTIQDDFLYGRGATDDKGQILAAILAVRAAISVTGKLPVNVRFLIEGEEECGGASIDAYIRENAAAIQCDAAVIADTHLLAPGIPAIVYGLRGLLYVEISAEGARHDLHSGLYGGVAPNPLHALALIIVGLRGEDGEINIPGLYTAVRPITDEERRWWSGYPFDESAKLREEMGVDVLAGEQRYSPLERHTTRPTLEVHGFIGGFQDEGAKAVVPARARVKVSLRLVPDQTADDVFLLLKKRVAELTPSGFRTDVKRIHGGDGAVLDTHNHFVDAVREALTAEYEHETYFTREGGAIPVAALFSHVMKVPVVCGGYGLLEDNLHAPNERFRLSNFRHALRGNVRFLHAVARRYTGGEQ